MKIKCMRFSYLKKKVILATKLNNINFLFKQIIHIIDKCLSSFNELIFLVEEINRKIWKLIYIISNYLFI